MTIRAERFELAVSVAVDEKGRAYTDLRELLLQWRDDCAPSISTSTLAAPSFYTALLIIYSHSLCPS